MARRGIRYGEGATVPHLCEVRKWYFSCVFEDYEQVGYVGHELTKYSSTEPNHLM